MKISAMPLDEVLNQLQILEYIESNTPQGLTDGDRAMRDELETRKKYLRGLPSAPRKHSLRDKLESAALRLDNYLDAVHALGPRENILLSAAREVAQAMEMLRDA